jgi:carboxypeptidase C (cathepsin A)
MPAVATAHLEEPAVTLRLSLLAVLAALFMQGAAAQPAPPSGHPPAAARSPERPLPPEAITHQTITLDGRTLHFTATAGSVHLMDAQGVAQADLAYIAYQLDGADPHTRPVTIAINGGPGSASAWLQLGALGPWRLPMAGAARAPSAPPLLVDNAQTWLDFTDLVFLDPAGTGYSRLANDSEPLRRHFWSVGGDIDSLADAIRQWLQQAGRLVSPKYIAGESYSGLRGPRLVRALADEQGVGISGLVLVSPVMDFGYDSDAFDPFYFMTRLPTMAAVAHHLEAGQLGDVEAYAAGDYLADLLRGNRDPAAIARVSARVAALTGLDPALVLRRHGRISPSTFLREANIKDERIGSPYDATETIPDPFPEYAYAESPDPVMASYGPPLTSAMIDLVTNRLGWHPDGEYELGNMRVFREWDWGHRRGRPNSIEALRTALALDPGLHVLIGHGLYDLVTPYFETKLLLAQVPDYGPGDRVRLVLHAGGHMFYTVDASRAALHDEARALVMGQ